MALGSPDHANEIIDLVLGDVLVLGDHTEITTSVTLLGDAAARVDVWSAGESGMERRATAMVRGMSDQPASQAHPNGTAKAVDLSAIFGPVAAARRSPA